MSKLDIFALSAPLAKEETRTLKSSDSSLEITVTFRNLNSSDHLRLSEIANERLVYHTGKNHAGEEDLGTNPPMPLDLVCQSPVVASFSLIHYTTMLELAQPDVSELEKYTYIDFIVLDHKRPDLMRDVSKFFAEVQDVKKKPAQEVPTLG